MEQLKQCAGVTGEISLKAFDQSALSEEDKDFNASIRFKRATDPDAMKLYRFGPLVQAETRKNVIAKAGRNAVCKFLCPSETYSGSGKINKMALGSGSGTPGESDVALFTEEYRNNTMSGTVVDNFIYLTAVFTEGECAGTFTEFGNFIDGGAEADSGLLWSHIAGLNWVKSDTIAFMVSCKYELKSI